MNPVSTVPHGEPRAPTSPSPGFAFPARPVAFIQAPRRMLVATVAVGLVAQGLLDRASWGVSFPLVILATLGALVALGGREAWERARPNAWLLGPVLVIAGFVAVRDSPWLRTLNVLTTSWLMLLLMHFWGGGRVQRLGMGGYPAVVLSSVGRGLAYPRVLAREAMDLASPRKRLPLLVPVLRGLLFALPVLMVFGMLLGGADVAFAAALERVFDVDLGDFVAESLRRVLGWLLCAVAAAGLLGHALRRRSSGEAGDAEEAPSERWLGFTEALVLILAVNALFLAFASFQVQYLFIGGASSPAPGYSYSEYARRGFFELLAVTVMTLGLVMGLARWARRESPVARLLFQVGTSVMVALTLVIVVSAMKRLVMYEDVFGYTRLRIFSHVFMVLLGVVLTWRGVTLWWRPERFAMGAHVAALVAVMGVNVINPDALIVRYSQVESSQVPKGWVDTALLRTLSADAVPELMRLYAGTPLLESALPVEACPEMTWPEWSVSRARACAVFGGVLPSPTRD
ncbi:DUF4173 domain-containing protein [Myxococcus stipitatus]|uniref:DUF4153 domain-containing protein n=1 Tax=Myxococcus stipitatus TaxID=83455 RepID=UPI0031452A41